MQVPSPKRPLQNKPAPTLCAGSGVAATPASPTWLRRAECVPHSPRGCGPQVTEVCVWTPRRTAHGAKLNAQREGTGGLRPLPSCAKETHPASFTAQRGTSPGNQPPGPPLHHPPVREPRNLWAPQRSHLRYGLTIPEAPGTCGGTRGLAWEMAYHCQRA